MAYDLTAKKVGVKAIAKVESNNDYGAINYNDPITVGVVQWFGNRAAAILVRMRTDNAAAWQGVASSIDSALTTTPSSNYAYWSSRYLTTAEGESLRPVLRNNVAIQNQQIVEDFEAYKNVAISYGFDIESNTKAVLFFFTMHHQSPASALRVVQNLGGNDSLDNIYQTALRDGTLGQYPNRLNEVYAIITAYDPSGIILPGDGENPPIDPPIDPPVDPPEEGGGEVPIRYLTVVGNSVRIVYTDGQKVDAYPDGRGQFLPSRQVGTTAPADPPIDPPIDPPVDPPAGGAWVHPLPGSIITSPYGDRAGGFHYGADFAYNGGATKDVFAPNAMIIDVADGTSNASAGFYVSARSVDGKYTFKFYHMQAGSLTVSPGQTVAAGTKIGIEGNTGNSFGAHLHFEVYTGHHNNPWPPPYGPTPIDPVPLLRANGVNV